tara:strand:- start:8231 stop:8578 length:348 start_codon:yes stop_codon:yes gene_type:complete
MESLIYYWIDVIWIPILFFGVHKKHRWWALGFVISTMILIRLQSEIMTHIGYEYGIIGYMTINVHTRLLAVSSFFYALYLLMAHFSSKTQGVVFMAASLSFFFMIFLIGSLVMLL